MHFLNRNVMEKTIFRILEAVGGGVQCTVYKNQVAITFIN